jgi:hypothetical protein
VRDRFVEPEDEVSRLLSLPVSQCFLALPAFLLTSLAGLGTVLVTASALSVFHGEAPVSDEFHDVAGYNMSMSSGTAVFCQKNSRKKTEIPLSVHRPCRRGWQGFLESSRNS